ncbi:hypothetical protein CHCC20335_2909 [Bacillus paralicheniformis]|nr:hypothetical protein CHCC20335_2909 [Bacillus paralicheniformis]
MQSLLHDDTPHSFMFWINEKGIDKYTRPLAILKNPTVWMLMIRLYLPLSITNELDDHSEPALLS